MMGDNELTKVTADLAAMICADIELGEEARALLTPTMTPAAFLQGLIEKQLFVDAIKFVARALPKREASWWACLCAHSVLAEKPDAEASRALELAGKWVYQPSEENRRLTYQAAEATGFKHPASWAAMAAYWSGGSLAPAEVPPVPPAENLTAQAVAGAVMLAAVHIDPEDAAQKYRRFLEQGIDIACGGNGRLQDASA